jgi:hypothetical protein
MTPYIKKKAYIFDKGDIGIFVNMFLDLGIFDKNRLFLFFIFFERRMPQSNKRNISQLVKLKDLTE